MNGLVRRKNGIASSAVLEKHPALRIPVKKVLKNFCLIADTDNSGECAFLEFIFISSLWREID
jgi:hypothetical protein